MNDSQQKHDTPAVVAGLGCGRSPDRATSVVAGLPTSVVAGLPTEPPPRPAGAQDPLELMAQPVPGDPALMLECILQEFAWMGWAAEQLLALFDHPGYPVLCQLREYFGDDEIRRQVESLLACGRVPCFRETIADPEPDEEHEPELVQITLPGQPAFQPNT